MIIRKNLINPNNYAVSTLWKIAEYSHDLRSQRIWLVVQWYVSQEALDAWVVNETRVYNLDAIKKYSKRDILEDVLVPAKYELSQWVDESGDPIEISTLISPEKTISVISWEESFWSNEDSYIDVSQLVQAIIPFIGNTLISRWDFIGGVIE